MSVNLRKLVLDSYKSLHKARLAVFKNDVYALEASRSRINEEFKKNKHITDNEKISELIQYSKEMENELRTTVIQLERVAPDHYRAHIRPEVTMLDNIPFDETKLKEDMK